MEQEMIEVVAQALPLAVVAQALPLAVLFYFPDPEGGNESATVPPPWLQMRFDRGQDPLILINTSLNLEESFLEEEEYTESMFLGA